MLVVCRGENKSIVIYCLMNIIVICFWLVHFLFQLLKESPQQQYQKKFDRETSAGHEMSMRRNSSHSLNEEVVEKNATR